MITPIITRTRPPRPTPAFETPAEPETPKTLASFIEATYERRSGFAVPFNRFCRRFWNFLETPEAPFDWHPARLRRELESQFPVAWYFKQGLCIGNLSGEGAVMSSTRELVGMYSMLVPRDLTHAEMIVFRGEVESELRRRKSRPVEQMSATAS